MLARSGAMAASVGLLEPWKMPVAAHQGHGRNQLTLFAAGRESRRLVDFANLTLAIAGKFEESLGPFDCLFLRFDLKQRKTADYFLRLGEGTIGHGELSSGDPDARAFRAGLASLGGEEYARFGHLFDELSHRGHVLR